MLEVGARSNPAQDERRLCVNSFICNLFMRISAHVERKTRTDPNMSELITNEPEGDAAFDLGEMLGSRRAFSAIAGRCSAADAACLRRIREEKLFITRAATWDEFCPKFL